MSEGSGSSSASPLGEPDADDVARFWDRAQRATGADLSAEVPSAWYFGDSAGLADELIELVINGPKRATAGAVAEYEADREPLPDVGDLSIVVDGSLRPRALLETTEVRVGPLSSVDDQFAWDEGEGDRTRRWWLDAHQRFFIRSFARLGLEYHPDIDVVFERFEVRYHEG